MSGVINAFGTAALCLGVATEEVAAIVTLAIMQPNVEGSFISIILCFDPDLFGGIHTEMQLRGPNARMETAGCPAVTNAPVALGRQRANSK